MDPSWAKAPSGNFQAKNQIPLTKISLQGNFPRSTDKTGAEHHASPGCQNGGNAAVFYWVVFNWCTWFWYRMSMMSMSHLWYLCAGLHQKTGLPKNTCFASGGHHKPAIPNDFLEMGFPHHSQMVVYCWVCKAYLREYPHKIWPEIWYSTSICWILKLPLTFESGLFLTHFSGTWRWAVPWLLCQWDFSVELMSSGWKQHPCCRVDDEFGWIITTLDILGIIIIQ